MPLVPINNESNRFGEKYLTIDKQKRLQLSAALRKELNIHGVPSWIVIAIDVENMRIGIVKQELAKVTNVKAFKLDQRGYCSGRYVMDKVNLNVDGTPYRFIDAGTEDQDGQRWRVFELVRD
jgi:hypothetical protein